VPLDFTVAAEFFQKAAALDNADAANRFGCCLEKGEGVEPNIELAVQYYRRAAARSHPSGMYNFGRCLEYGLGIAQDFIRAAKFYRLSADLGNAAAQNSFGVCLERGIGVKSNLALSARYYQRSAAQGDSDGANNLGFCLERGRGVHEDIEAAAECYAFAAECGHPEGELNFRRCLRILGRFEPDRSSRVSDPPQSDNPLTKRFLACLNDSEAIDRAGPETIASLRRLKASIALRTNGPGHGAVFTAETAQTKSTELMEGSGDRCVILKPAGGPREVEALKRLNHPLIIALHTHSPAAIVTEAPPNGSLAEYLPWMEGSEPCPPRRPTWIATVITGVALAMRFVHERGIAHRALSPARIFIDWDWTVRIGGFDQCTFIDRPPPETQPKWPWPIVDLRFAAPERYENGGSTESDVFSFGLIVYELIVWGPGLPRKLSELHWTKSIVVKDRRPEFPDSVPLHVRELIEDCWATNPAHRPTFDVIVFRLEQMQFKVTAGVDSAKVATFLEKIERWEREQSEAPQIDGRASFSIAH
jgi:TPR repeat protein